MTAERCRVAFLQLSINCQEHSARLSGVVHEKTLLEACKQLFLLLCWKQLGYARTSHALQKTSPPTSAGCGVVPQGSNVQDLYVWWGFVPMKAEAQELRFPLWTQIQHTDYH